MLLFELLKAAAWGLVEGVTEWLPISSTGHMILLDELIRLDMSEAFKDMFLVVIQLGAILAVALLFFKKLNPFSPAKKAAEKRDTMRIWSAHTLLSGTYLQNGFFHRDISGSVFSARHLALRRNNSRRDSARRLPPPRRGIFLLPLRSDYVRSQHAEAL